MTPDPDARRRALEQILVNGIGAPPDVRLQPVDLAPLAPARLEQPQEGIATTLQPVRFPYRPEDDQEAQIRAQADEAVRFANLGEVSSRAIEGFTGARGADIWTPMRQRADEPLKAFLALQQRKEGRAATGKAAKSPPSPADIETLHAFARARWPQEPEAIISGITPDRFESIRKTLDAKYRIKSSEGLTDKQIEATAERARLDRKQRSQRTALDDAQFWAKMTQDAEQFGVSDATRRYIAEQALKAAEAARDAAAADRQGERIRESTVPGFEPVGDVLPTRADAEKLKETSEAAARMHGNIADLRELHKKYGETPKGFGAELQQQKLRAIQIEAKNIAGLGALSGPDFGLMQDLSAQDTNSIIAWVRRTFAGASLEQSLQGLEQWMNTTIAATAKARGYAPKTPKPGPARVPPSRGLPTGPDGKPTLDTAGSSTVRVRINGTPLDIPRANVEAARKRAAEKGHTFEVIDG